jgi:membrane peptidoglycan carboxypeptidase
MRARGPAWERAPGCYDPATDPVPYGASPEDPDDDYDDYEQADWGRPRRGWRMVRRLLAVLLALLVLGAATFGVLLLLTPSVGNAPSLSRAIDQAHHVAYPGPPVPKLFAESLVATEDHRFYSEPGVDVFAIARVAAATIQRRGDQGGATLYQQLAKMLYTPGRSGLPTEVEQIMLGIKLDMSYSRPQILRMYSDVAYFGHGYYGLAAASCGYFATSPAGLTLPQAATLAGLVQAPSADDPIAHYARGRAREAHVLGRLVATGKITQSRATAAFTQRLALAGGPGTGCTR